MLLGSNPRCLHRYLNIPPVQILLPGLHREWFVQELLIEVLLDVLDKDDRFALVIKLRSTRSTHHLQNIYVGRTDHHSQSPQYSPNMETELGSGHL